MIRMRSRLQTECFPMCRNSIVHIIDVACLVESCVKGSAEVIDRVGMIEVEDRLQSECCS